MNDARSQSTATVRNGGDIVSEVLRAQGVQHLFALCGGHISPILVSAKRDGIRVVDVRDEASAVFAADAVARMTGVPGVAAVTAGPGLTNTLTAVENALLANSPLIILGGATATFLKGRGALQDIDQMALMKPAVKEAFAVKRVRHLGPTLEKAFQVAQEGVPGPVFVEVPVDLLYSEDQVRDMVANELVGGDSMLGKALQAYAAQHLFRVFFGKDAFRAGPRVAVDPMDPAKGQVAKAAELVRKAERPVLVVGAQTVVRAEEAVAVADAIRALGIPVFLGGGARGLLGRKDPRQFRHKRGKALAKADLVIVCGFPFDFRMGYGWKINPDAHIVQVNRDRGVLWKNRIPSLAVHADAGRFLQALTRELGPVREGTWAPWFQRLQESEDARDAEIVSLSEAGSTYLNPLELCRRIEEVMDDDAVMVVDGGDFVATAAYITRPRGPLAWLDPGVYGTLGVGGGFAVGAAAAAPGREIWVFYGDGASAYSLAELDTLARHGMAVIAVIGNDACWAQIARDQVVLLGDDVGTGLERTDYHTVAKGYGAQGLLLKRRQDIKGVLDQAKALAREGKPVLINAWIDRSEFRKGSISI
ncbi:MAG: thiamine pyrophosphate-binding protein [Alphaproteobacteria bacterium]|nr:thiamine pyrophosphate-binding protein [Alphaproteobacteria bacterium]